MSNWILYAITVLIWGSTWLMIEFQLGVVPPEVSVFYRYLFSALILFGWCMLRGMRLRYDLRAHLTFALLGLLLFSLNYIVTYNSQRYVTSALIAVVFSMMLWMNIVNSFLFFGVRADRRVIIGAILGVVGIGFIFVPSVTDLSFADVTVIGASLGLIGAYMSSLGNMVSQAAQRRQLPIVQSNAWGMLYGAVFTGVIAAASGREFMFDTSPAYVLSLGYLVVFGSVIGFGAYLTLLGRIGAHKAGYAMILFPVIAVFLSVLFEGLEITRPIMFGIVLVLFGNYFVMRPARKGETAEVTIRPIADGAPNAKVFADVGRPAP